MEQSWKDLCARYPAYESEAVLEGLHAALRSFSDTIVVLDDDPTGTQTVQGVPVITRWETALLQQELEKSPRMLFILTNSRALSEKDTQALHRELAENLHQAATRAGRGVLLISRGDSTLRGHFPLETETLRATLEPHMDRGFDGEIICPFFPEGGRYTAEDIHYLVEGDVLVPVGESEFAKDKTFGYQNSNLAAWIEEKTGGAHPADSVLSVSLSALRRQDTGEILQILRQAKNFQKIIVNAISYEDLEVFVPLLIQVIAEGRQFLLRTAAAFLKVILGCMGSTILTREDLVDATNRHGGLVVAGSHVKKTTAQLEHLRENGAVELVEFNQHLVLDEGAFQGEILRAGQAAAALIGAGTTVVLATRRERLDLGGADKEAELALAKKISDGLVSVVSGLTLRPGFIIAKGGITSSDVATNGLGIRRAEVLGQILPGIPVWKTGPESKFPSMPYVVFPGNVGAESALSEAVEKLTP